MKLLGKVLNARDILKEVIWVIMVLELEVP